MAVIKKSVLDRIATDTAGKGTVQLHWSKMTLSDGELVAREGHIALMQAGDDIDELISRETESLAQLGFPRTEDGITVAGMKSFAADLWTAPRVAAVTQRRAADKAASEKNDADRNRDELARAAAALAEEVAEDAENKALIEEVVRLALAAQPTKL